MVTPTMLPVSRAQMELKPSGDEKAIGEAIRWLKVRSGVTFPASAFTGEPFQTGLDAAAPAFAATGLIDGVLYWGAKLRVPDSELPRRSWHTEIVIRRDERPHVAVRLAVFDDREQLAANPPIRTVPGLVLQLVDNVGAYDGNMELAAGLSRISSSEEFRQLVIDSGRALPVLAFGQGAFEEWPREIEEISKRLAGISHNVVIESIASHEVAKKYIKPLTVFGLYAKLYYPMNVEDHINPYDHPIFNLVNLTASKLTGEVIRLAARLRPVGGQQLPRLATVQQAELQTADARGDDTALHLATQLEAELTAEIEARDELLDQAARVERETASELRELKARLEQAQRTFEALDAITTKLVSGTVPDEVPPLRTPHIIGAWCSLTGAGHLVPTDRFLKECESLPDDETYLYRVAVGLHGIAQVTAGIIPATGKDVSLSMGVKVCPVGNTSGFDDYDFVHDGGRYRSDWHAKWGNGRDIRSAYRIYYYWDTANRKAILQSVGTHMDNWSTN